MNRHELLRSDRVRLALLIGLCTALGIYLILMTAVITKDGVFYIEQAKVLWQDPAGVCTRCPPGYPFLLWTSHRIASLFVSGDSPASWANSARAVTLLCRVLALIPLYFLGKRLVGAGHSFWALLVLVVLPYPAFYGSDTLREWPYILFLSTGVLLLYWGLTTRRWWVFALVGLDAGLGCLVRPECLQLLACALLGLFVAEDSSRVIRHASCGRQTWTRISRCAAGLVMVGVLGMSVAPYVHARGGITPDQLRPSPFNMAPVISAVGSKAAQDIPLEFEVRQGELLELPIRASDPDNDAISFSLAQIAKASRPVYVFRSATLNASFWTISEQEKDLLTTHHPKTWEYEGIAWYAYSHPDAKPGLQPVYRFWSPASQRHFYTASESEKEAVIAESTSDSWTCEGIVFYAFGEKNRPADVAAVYRLWDAERGFSWATTPSAGSDVREDSVAWHVHLAGAPPAGAGIEDGVFRWRPGAAQQGEYTMNIIVTDGKLPCCQLVTVRVTGAGSVHQHRLHEEWSPTHAGMALCCWAQLWNLNAVALRSPALRDLARAVNNVVAGIGEDLMVILVLPWILGLHLYLRRRAGTLERVLIAAVLIVNVGLMLCRQVWVESGSDRRYAVPMISLTILFLPIGLDALSAALGCIRALRAKPPSFWFRVLLMGSIVSCMPKLLLTPLRSEKIGLRKAGEWLYQNTPADSVVAEPDRRVSFYGRRRGLYYEQHPDSRKADYVVEIARGEPIQMLEGWTQVYSTALDRRSNKKVIIYRTQPPNHQAGAVEISNDGDRGGR